MIPTENPFTWMYFPTALGLGALHALEPGHAKTLTAAYLIGIKGTKRDALLLGVSVATTHSIVVVGLSIAALWVGQEAFTEHATQILQVSSGVVVVLLGSWMLFNRIRRLKAKTYHHHSQHKLAPFSPIRFGTAQHHDHSQMSDDEHARAHAASLPEYVKHGERPSFMQILAFGAAGGMIPCPASITVMLLALSIGKFSSGLFAVAGFSLGLALTLVGVGMVIVAGLTRLNQGGGKLHWVSSKAPIISAAVVIISGLASLLFVH